MKKILAVLALSLLCGCAGGNIITKKVDGKLTDCQASYYSLFKDVNDINLAACGAKGGAETSKVNTALIEQLLKVLIVAAP